MDRITVIFPFADGDSSCIDPRLEREYEACKADDAFEVVLCNIEDCIAGDELVVDRASPRKTTYCLLRTVPTWRTKYGRIERELKRKGYKLIVTDEGRYHYQWNDWDRLMCMFSSGIPTHRKRTPYDTQKAEWRGYFFDGVYFYGTRLKRGHKDDRPPDHLLSLAEGRYDTKPFCYIDFYKHEKGFWLPLTMGDAQFSTLPKNASAEEFYGRLADVMAEAPHLPEWTWCLVGNVVDQNRTGMDGRVVRGTRNFAPGTKVYLICELGGNGWERPCVLGVPRYCDHLVSLLMSVQKLCEIRCEKVYNRDVIAVMENAHFGDFFCPVKSEHDGVWDKSFRSLNTIAILLDWMPEYYGISRGVDPEDYFDDEGWANRPFKHVCEVCGKEETLTPNEAKSAGWDYPGKLGDFGVVSPRICGDCPVEETFWWAQSQPGMHRWSQEIPSEKRKVYKRILKEPDVLFTGIDYR